MTDLRSTLAAIASDMSGRGKDMMAHRASYHLERLAALKVEGVERLAVKLRDAARAGSDSEFRGILAEAFYALRFADAGAAVSLEPVGRVGPDLLVTSGDFRLYVEVKRLTVTGHRHTLETEEWYSNETRPQVDPLGPDSPTLRLLGCLRSAERQLIADAANLVVVHDFSVEVTRASFLSAVQSIQEEMASAQIHARLSAVFYHSNYTASGAPPPDWLWVSAGSSREIEDLCRRSFDQPVLVA
jgi:hypothetical protein